jgi:hypothetical protein
MKCCSLACCGNGPRTSQLECNCTSHPLKVELETSSTNRGGDIFHCDAVAVTDDRRADNMVSSKNIAGSIQLIRVEAMTLLVYTGGKSLYIGNHDNTRSHL